MSLTNPWGLLALLGIPVILYWHRRTASDRRLVPLIALWRPGAAQAPSGARRRRIDAILLLRLAMVAAVALALAQPSWPVPANVQHVFLVDASASMGAREAGGLRFARAIEAAQDVLDHLPARAEVMIIRGGMPPTVVHGFSRDRSALRAALGAMRAGEAPKNLSAGLLLARRDADGVRGLIHVFSDVPDPKAVARQAERLGVSEGNLSVHLVGGPAENLGIVRLEAAPLSQSPLDYAVVAVVGNYTRETRTAAVSLNLPRGVQERRRISLAPGERKPVPFTVPAVPWVEVRLEDNADALPLDDRASLVLPIAPLRVLYASRSDRFLDAAIRAHPRVEIQRIPPERLSQEHCASVGADVAVVDGTPPPPGCRVPVLAFAAARPGGSAHAVPIVEWQRGHPLLRELDLGEVLVPADAVLSAGGGALIRSADGPVARAALVEGVRRVELAFPADRSNIGQTPVFPVLVARALEWLADRNASALNLTVGQPLRVSVPPAWRGDLTVTRPDGSIVRVAAENGFLDFPATDMAGLYIVEGPGVTLPVAVRLVDPDESNLDRPASPPEASLSLNAAAADRADVSRPVLAAGLILLSLETWLLQRRMRGARR